MRFIAVILLILASASLLVAQQPVAPGIAVATQTPDAAAQANPQLVPGSPNTAAVTDRPAPDSQKPTAPSNQASSAPAESKNVILPAPPGTAVIPLADKRQQAEGKRQFEAGVKLSKKGDSEAAYDKFSSASELDPQNLNYLTAREFIREQLAMQALQRGNKAMMDGNEIVAMAEFRRALEYDPTNNYAQQRIKDAMPQADEAAPSASVVEQSVPIQLRPIAKHQDFHYRGDARALLTQVAQGYGITAQFDDSVQQRRVHFDIQDVNFATAIRAAASVTKTFYVPLSTSQILCLADTTENHRSFDRMGLRTFFLPELSDQQLAEMTNSLRVLLNLRYISQDRAESAITIRAEMPVLEAADHLIKSLTAGRPEVLLDIKVFAVSTSLARALGTVLPTQFTMFNISPALIAGLGAAAQSLINQLIASGGINAGNVSAIAALLAQQQSSATSSLLTTPFVSFGGGVTTFGLNAHGVGVTPTFSVNQSDISSLEHVTLRASHNDAAVMKIGARYPIINATFAPIYNTSAISKVIGNKSYIAPFPSFNFEDIGLILKATPLIHANRDVTLKLDLQLRSLGTTNVNGIPIINNREYNGIITVKNDESSVVTGLISMNDTHDINGYPFLSRVPGLGYGTSIRNKNVSDEELLVVITPHILRLPEQTSFAVELPPSR